MERNSTAPLETGDILAGKYRIERVLGAGGMGTVVAATHLDLQELRAIKLMNPTLANSPLAIERFLREARAAVRIKSEHVTKVFDVGRLESGAPYIVMEHLTGSDLRDISARRGPLPIEEAVLYVLQACDALAEAHNLGIVHRDLKPSNLFLTSRADGSPCIKLLDFGISKVVAGEDEEPDMTKTHEILGSPLYMAPEQMRSKQTVDARTDIWALGVILYKLLTGRLPFFGKGTLEICAVVLERAPMPPSLIRPELPHDLEAVILRCLAKEPSDRIPSVPALMAELAPFTRPCATEEVTIPVDLVDEFEPDSKRISVKIVEEFESMPTTGSTIRVPTHPLGDATIKTPPPKALFEAHQRPEPGQSAFVRLAIAAFGLIASLSVVTAGGALVSNHGADHPAHAAQPPPMLAPPTPAPASAVSPTSAPAPAPHPSSATTTHVSGIHSVAWRPGTSLQEKAPEAKGPFLPLNLQ